MCLIYYIDKGLGIFSTVKKGKNYGSVIRIREERLNQKGEFMREEGAFYQPFAC